MKESERFLRFPVDKVATFGDILTMTTVKYFSGETELKGAYPVKREAVRAKFPEGKIKRYDSFNLMVGTVDGKYNLIDFLPVTRIIAYNPNGSMHKCDSRCQSAKGGNCECSCGGVMHGINA